MKSCENMKINSFFFTVLIALFACLPLMAQSVKTSKADKEESVKLSEEAWKLYESSDYKNALTKSISAIKLDNKNPEAFYWAGMASDSLERNEESIEYFENAVKLNPDVSFNYYLALAYMKSFDKDRSIPVMLKVIDLDPNYSDAYDRLGRFYLFDKKESEQSLKYLQKYSELNRNEYSLYHLGIAFSRLKQFDKAMKCFIDAENIVISNKSADTWIIDNLKWAIENTENNEPLFF